MSCIRVALRIRPESHGDDSNPSLADSSCIHVSSAKSVQVKRTRELTGDQQTQQYTFDHVFTQQSTQEEVFSSVRDLINEALLGFNVTVFAFGMTGSGKTFTISGTQASPGIVPRTVHHVFASLRQHAARHKENVAMVFLSFVELYNNTLHDLLAPTGVHDGGASSSSSSNIHAPSHTDGPIKIHEHPQRGIQLSGSATLRTPVASAEEALLLIQRGNRGRATGNTNLNERSSRSHTVITLEILSQSRGGVGGAQQAGASAGSTTSSSGGGAVTAFGKINMVDLAGSERVKMSGAEGQTLVEAQQINKALSVLGDVLSSLSKFNLEEAGSAETAAGAVTTTTTTTTAAPPHIPYRNSKLTMLLKDSLGGNAKTMMIATIRPNLAFFSQTLTSLKYAARARHIKCHPVSSLTTLKEGASSSSGGIQKTLEEVARLRSMLDERTRESDELKRRLEVLEKEREERRQNIGSGVGAKVDTVTAAGGNGASNVNGGANGKASTNGATAAEEDLRQAKEMAEYRKQLAALQQQSQNERRMLQESMRKVIHSHEGALAEKEREFVTLELQLAQQAARIEALSRDKQSIESSTHGLEQERASLFARVQQYQADSITLQLENSDLKKRLVSLSDQKSESSMTAADKQQFIEALQKVTASRGKYKLRAEEWEAKVKALLAEKETLISELESERKGREKDKLREKEGEGLMDAAAKRIRALEGKIREMQGALGGGDSSSNAQQSIHGGSVAATMATTIELESSRAELEARASVIAEMEQKLARSSEREAQALRIIKQEMDKSALLLQERDGLKAAIEARAQEASRERPAAANSSAVSTEQESLEAVRNELAETRLARDQALALARSTESSKLDLESTRLELEQKQEQQRRVLVELELTLKEAQTKVQDLEAQKQQVSQAAAAAEARFLCEREERQEADRLRIASLEDELASLRAQANAGSVDNFDSTEREWQREQELEERLKSEMGRERERERERDREEHMAIVAQIRAEAVLSEEARQAACDEQAALKRRLEEAEGTIAALVGQSDSVSRNAQALAQKLLQEQERERQREQEKGKERDNAMFAELESKLSALDTARGKLLKLKTLSARSALAPPPASLALLRDIEGSALLLDPAKAAELWHSAEQRGEQMESELGQLRIANKELQARLQGKTSALSKEQEAIRVLQQTLATERRERRIEVDRMASLVTQHLAEREQFSVQSRRDVSLLSRSIASGSFDGIGSTDYRDVTSPLTFVSDAQDARDPDGDGELGTSISFATARDEDGDNDGADDDSLGSVIDSIDVDSGAHQTYGDDDFESDGETE